MSKKALNKLAMLLFFIGVLLSFFAYTDVIKWAARFTLSIAFITFLINLFVNKKSDQVDAVTFYGLKGQDKEGAAQHVDDDFD